MKTCGIKCYGFLYCENLGLIKLLYFLNRSIPSGGEATVSFKLTPKFSGRSTIAAKFVSKELDDVDGFLALMIEPKKEVVNGTGNAA